MTRIILICLLFFAHVVVAQEADSSISQDNSNIQIDTLTRSVSNPELDLIVAPEGFDTSAYFHGYIHFVKRTAIIMYEISNLDPKKVMAEANEDYFTENSMTLLSKEEFVSEHGTKGFYLKSSYENKGNTYVRYMVYAGNNNNTLILDIVHPIDLKIDDELQKCFNSINYLR